MVCVTPGKDAHTVERFARDFMDHNGDPDRVRLVTCDMSRGFAKGIREHLPNAAKVIDRFHVVKHANEAVYKVHKAEDRENGLLKKDEVPVAQERVEPDRTPIGDQARPAEASAQDRPGLPDARDPPGHLRHQREQDRGRNGAQTPVLVDDAIEAGAHEGPRPTAPPPLGRYFDHRRTNAVLEGLNSIIQNVKTRARGFRNMDYFSTMIYLTCGRLDLRTVAT